MNKKSYISISVNEGYVELSYELGTGPALVRSSTRVNDGGRHILVVRRTGQQGSLKVDRSAPVYGQSPGIRHMLNAKGNIYIGNFKSCIKLRVLLRCIMMVI